MKSYKYEIFTSVIEEQIRNGVVKENDRLPSIREIRKRYRLSTSSVQSGFEYLMIKGLIKSSPRSGYFVADQKQNGDHKKTGQLPPVVRNEIFMKNMMLTSKGFLKPVPLMLRLPVTCLFPEINSENDAGSDP